MDAAFPGILRQTASGVLLVAMLTKLFLCKISSPTAIMRNVFGIANRIVFADKPLYRIARFKLHGADAQRRRNTGEKGPERRCRKRPYFEFDSATRLTSHHSRPTYTGPG